MKGLINGTAYTFELRAVGAVGEGAAAESDPVTPAPPPFVPKTCTLNPGDVWVRDGDGGEGGRSQRKDHRAWLP